MTVRTGPQPARQPGVQPAAAPSGGGTPPARGPLLQVERLSVSFAGPRHAGPRVQAVSDASMTLYPEQTLAVVGESGSGKSVTALSVLQLLPRPPARFDRGRILLAGTGPGEPPADLLAMSPSQIRQIRGAQIAMIFQEPMSSLNPVFTVGQQLIEAVRLHESVPLAQARQTAVEAMTAVGIGDASVRLEAYPHQFSGGMRQRVMIAMALACRPRVLLADEPTTALDVTIQAQVLALLRELQSSTGMGIMLITHALGVVAQNADVVAVMYAGRVVEYAPVRALFARPLHPYTRGLLASIPSLRTRVDRLTTIRQLTADPAEFSTLGQELVPWWPEHQAVAHTVAEPSTGVDSTLVEIEPSHWVALWRNPAAMALPATPPDVPGRRSPPNVRASRQPL